MTRFDADEICRRVSLDGWDHLLRAERQGRGVLLLTAHLGSWEMMGDPVSLYRGAAHAIARPADNPYLDRTVRRLRGRFGVVTIDRRGAGRRAMRALKNGERVWILADQRVHPREGIELPFLGRPATTSTLAARLALRYGTPAVPIFCYPEPRGRFRIEVRPAIRPEGSGDDGGRRPDGALRRGHRGGDPAPSGDVAVDAQPLAPAAAARDRRRRPLDERHAGLRAQLGGRHGHGPAGDRGAGRRRPAGDRARPAAPGVAARALPGGGRRRAARRRRRRHGRRAAPPAASTRRCCCPTPFAPPG